MKKNLFLWALVLVLGLSVQACRETGLNPWEKPKDENPKDNNNGKTPLQKMLGTSWSLTRIENSDGSILEANDIETVSLTFTSTTNVSGKTPCNGYGAKVSSNNPGEITISDLFSTDAVCGELDNQYLRSLQSAKYFDLVNGSELIIKCVGSATNTESVLYFKSLVPQTEEPNLRLQQLESKMFTLYSFVDADLEFKMPGADKCTIYFLPNALGQGKGYVNFRAICNKGYADLTFSNDYKEMNLSNVTVSNELCENPETGDRFVEFLKNVGRFEYSDYGTTLTIWSSLPTFAESKMVLKVSENIVDDVIDIFETPSTGVPANTFPMLYITQLDYDGYININYEYGGEIQDYRITAYSDFQFGKSDPPVFVIDLVTDGTPNQISKLSKGRVRISLNEVRKRVLPATPGSVKMRAIIRWDNKEVGSLDVAL